MPGYTPREIPEYLIRYAAGDEIADKLSLAQTSALEPRILTHIARLNLGLLEILGDRFLVFRRLIRFFNRVVPYHIFVFLNKGKPIEFYVPRSIPQKRSPTPKMPTIKPLIQENK